MLRRLAIALFSTATDSPSSCTILSVRSVSDSNIPANPFPSRVDTVSSP
jgi:hypothetical protein